MDKEKIKKLRIICKNIAVLFVEDDKSISQQFEKLLCKIFTNISVEKNGLLGLENFSKNRQEIVITDISMPIMDGLEMSKKIKLLNPEQNIIVTSAHNDMEYLLQLIDIGVDRFILKPIDFNAFFTSISKVAISIYREKKEALLEDELFRCKNIQVEVLNKELKKFRNSYNNFEIREDFEQKILSIVSDARSKEYTFFCIGLKKREFILTYGGKEMHTINKEFAQKLKKDLHVEIVDGGVFLYFFETNRYIILTEKRSLVQVKKKLDTFGARNRYNFGSRLSFNIEITQQLVESDMSVEEILKKAEGMLYIFD